MYTQSCCWFNFNIIYFISKLEIFNITIIGPNSKVNNISIEQLNKFCKIISALIAPKTYIKTLVLNAIGSIETMIFKTLSSILNAPKYRKYGTSKPYQTYMPQIPCRISTPPSPKILCITSQVVMVYIFVVKLHYVNVAWHTESPSQANVNV